MAFRMLSKSGRFVCCSVPARAAAWRFFVQLGGIGKSAVTDSATGPSITGRPAMACCAKMATRASYLLVLAGV